MQRIPIHYVDRPGFKSQLLSEKSPVIDVVIGHIAPDGSNRLRNLKALIDSGADDIFVDEALLKDCGCPLLESTSDVRTLHGTKSSRMYRVSMLFPEQDVLNELDVIATDYPRGVRAYEAVFGTRFLELGVLVLDPQGESHFTIHEHSVSAEKSKGTSTADGD